MFLFGQLRGCLEKVTETFKKTMFLNRCVYGLWQCMKNEWLQAILFEENYLFKLERKKHHGYVIEIHSPKKHIIGKVTDNKKHKK